MPILLCTPFKPLRCLLLLLFVCTGLGSSRAVSQSTDVLGVNITLEVSKSRIIVGEPLTLKIILDNQSAMASVDVTASYQLAEGNDIILKVQPPGELPYRYEGALDSGVYTRVPLRLVRGIPRVIEKMLLYDRTQPNGFLFNKPGKYLIGGTFRLSLFNNPNFDEVALPATEIEVLPAEGRDKEVYELVDEPDLVKSLHLGIAQTTEVLKRLEPVGEKYADTMLGALALRSVGQHYAHSNPSTREKGAAMLTRYLESGLVPMDGDYTAWSIGAAYHLAGKYDLAREWIFYTVRHYPKSMRVRPEDALFKFYVYDPAAFASQVPWYMLKTPWEIPGAQPPTDLRPVQDAQ